MQLSLFFRDLGKTEATESFLMEKADCIESHFAKNDPSAHLAIRVESDRRRSSGRKPTFTCELVLKTRNQKSPYKVQKSAEEFHTAVNDAVLALKNILSRRSARRAQHRRHSHDRELRSLGLAS